MVENSSYLGVTVYCAIFGSILAASAWRKRKPLVQAVNIIAETLSKMYMAFVW